MRIRDEWNVKRSGAIDSRARKSAGISVSIVTLELGTIWPIRKRFNLLTLAGEKNPMPLLRPP